jgi:hypothetical protein
MHIRGDIHHLEEVIRVCRARGLVVRDETREIPDGGLVGRFEGVAEFARELGVQVRGPDGVREVLMRGAFD